MTDSMLEMRGITKRFPGVLANDNVDFDVRRGEVHTLLGENGAGKSTLMKILFGLYTADEGTITFEGAPLRVDSPAAAIEAGIGMIHQHFMLVPTFTVTENVALGLGTADMGQVRDHLTELAETYSLDVDPDALIWQLAVGERQRVEILKALYRDAQLLVLDEPTAVLTPQEVNDFFVTLRQIAQDGRGLIFISHKLHEVMALSDRITVLRDGKVSGSTTPAETSRQQLAQMMVGRPVKLAPDKPPVEVGDSRLELKDLSVMGDRDALAVDAVSLAVAAGEIVGVAGVSGNGQRELCEAVAGLRPVTEGSVRLDGQDTTGASPRRYREAGLAFVPEERMLHGAVGQFSVSENLMLLNHDSQEYSRWGFLKLPALRERAGRLVEHYDVKTPSIDTATSALSGGNIQKLIMARELSAEPAVLIAAQPTRGVDIGAAEYIHERLIAQREQGTAVLVVSEDLDEVLALADRVAVMFEGRIVAIIDREDCTVEDLGLLMAGAQP
ncbi:MAG: ABC transporter ATP-binding protein [Acidimicrobiaceae bacterium]|nr:ABC transporter ATP-binding protein [Acidimicrobiaceae bacterium]MXW62340.1 ABC transporter ATP-binding protein [Acidimicrobiaceae bacterium]MXW74959.1 ABC transporter ATP-binding protein [Acidimicrobiaceae bacterium]MYA73682.1 ABC transporter ATP-binding protein [Acidimicrobiaceae bacterium]MYC41212.1 ABC transporter ATP-binding protein [Acidimicrobiaceae bacterium]